MVDLSGKTALVTGATSGIGLAIAKSLGRAGARIALHGRVESSKVEKAVSEVLASGAPDVRYFHADMRDVRAIETMMSAVTEWKDVDILVNNAGIQKTISLAEVDAETWDEIIAVNLSSVFHTMRLALPAMAQRGYGRIINIASVHGLVASVHKAPYVAAKHGMVGLSRVAALEYATAGSRASGGVTVNCIAPGWTDTKIIEPQIQARAALFGGNRENGLANLLEEKQPTRRISDPTEIAALALWLCDPLMHNLTGAVIPVDGGWTAQ